MTHCNRRLLPTLCAGLLCAALIAGPAAANVLVNPDFETGDVTGWITAGLAGSATITVESGINGPTLPGDHAVFMANSQPALGLVLKQSTLPGTIEPGAVPYSVDLKLGQSANGGVFFIQLFAEQDGIGIIADSGVMGPYFPADWITVSGSFMAPAGTDFVTIQLSAITGAVEGSISTMYVDNVTVGDAAVANESADWGGVKALFR